MSGGGGGVECRVDRVECQVDGVECLVDWEKWRVDRVECQVDWAYAFSRLTRWGRSVGIVLLLQLR